MSRYGMAGVVGRLLVFMFFAVSFVSAESETGRSTASIDLFFQSIPSESNRYVICRLTSIRTERTLDEREREHIIKVSRVKNLSDESLQEVEKRMEVWREGSEKEFKRVLEVAGENDPIYYFRYIDTANHATETGYFILKNAEVVRRMVMEVERDVPVGSQNSSKPQSDD